MSTYIQAKRDEEGFTLIELLVVVIIIGILAAIAIPTFLAQRQRAWDSAAKSDLRNAAVAQESQFTQSNTYTDVLAELTAEGFNQGAAINFTVPLATSTEYCMQANHTSGAQNVFHFRSATGEPLPGACP